jgi:hypothetical protein
MTPSDHQDHERYLSVFSDGVPGAATPQFECDDKNA